jgi:excisionase family DNA binding protein
VEPLLYRAEEAAKVLGLGRSKVFMMLARGELPCVRIGRSVRVPRHALEAWIRQQTENTNGQPANGSV